MKRHIKEYIYKQEWSGFGVALVSSVLQAVVEDKVEELYMSDRDYNIIMRYMITVGAWNWDKKTFMGVKLIINNE